MIVKKYQKIGTKWSPWALLDVKLLTIVYSFMSLVLISIYVYHRTQCIPFIENHYQGLEKEGRRQPILIIFVYMYRCAYM